MKIAKPDDRTTLLLNKYHEPFGVCTAKAAFRHLITGRVIGIDAADNLHSWDGKYFDHPELEPSFISWKNKNVELFEDQPALRSAPVDEVETFWYIPTIVRCNRVFGYRAKAGKDISLRKIYNLYKGVCQYCLKDISFSVATKDHIYPKKLHGSNHDFNLVLACKACNNEKDDQYPYLNNEGNEVKPKKSLPSGMFLPDEKLIRPEWKRYLFLEC